MSKFIACFEKGFFINMDLVASIRKTGKGYAECYSASGETIGKIHDFEIPSSADAIIPAAVGSFVWVTWIDDQDVNPVQCQKTTVIAWSIAMSGADPVFVEKLADNQEWWIEHPDGRVESPFNAVFPSVSALKSHLLAEHTAKKTAQT